MLGKALAAKFAATLALASGLFAAGVSGAGQSESDAIQARDDRIAALERTVNALAEELSDVRTQVAVPEEQELVSEYGLGPAASKIYGIERGLTIGGYAEGYYRKIVGNGGTGVLDTSDLLRMVMYLGYKFTDRIQFNAEIEFEHGSTSSTKSAGSGSASVEFAALDFLYNEKLNTRTGMVLVPMGFLNELHEPPFFHGVARPEVETRIIPSTWRANGAGIYGRWGESLQYRGYVINSLTAEGFGANGLRGGRQKGNRALAEDLAGVVRLDWTPCDEFLIGGSFFRGHTGQNQSLTSTSGNPVEMPDAPLTLWEAHAQYRDHGLEARALFTMAHLGEAQELTRALRAIGEIDSSEAIADRMLGGYAEVAYDVWQLLFPGSTRYLAPFVRVEYYDTQYRVPTPFERDKSQQQLLFTPGLTYKPHPNVVLKMDYRNFRPTDGERADELQLGFGVAF